MDARTVGKAIARVREVVAGLEPAAVGEVARDRDPYKVLVACILSLRTRDAVTKVASRRLLERAPDPTALEAMDCEDLEQVIYPVCFYRTKARGLIALARVLRERHEGRVPDRLEELIELPGVGRKTANLVVTLAYGKPGICVDTHVHRVMNRWGFVRTRSADDTERALRRRLPRRHWILLNDLLVPYGQNVCTPLSPFCSRCPVEPLCPRLGVGRRR